MWEVLERMKRRLPADDPALLTAMKFQLGLEVVLTDAEHNGQSPKLAKIASQRADKLVDEILSFLARRSIDPEDRNQLLETALLHGWFNKRSEHADESRRLVEAAERSADPVGMFHAAVAVCAYPSNDRAMIDRALGLARRAAAATRGSATEYWFQLTFGLAAFRAGGLDIEAEEALRRAIDAVGKLDSSLERPAQASAKLILSMVLYRNGKRPDALALFSEIEQVAKLPADDRQILEPDSALDLLMVWIPYKEAKALLQ
jgi:hypothetical protein